MAVLSFSLPELSSEFHRVDGLDNCAVLIPAWKPEQRLVSMVAALVERGYGAVIVVDDGSGEESAAIFEELTEIPVVHVLRHVINMGKGRALKTGISYFMSNLNFRAIVTADADGQHALEDIERVALLPNGQAVLGVRSFANDVPIRSRVGNLLTRGIFKLVAGAKLADTQTGLRRFSRELLPDLLRLDGERYEYEMNVLVYLCRGEMLPVEVPIKTIYIDGNRSSHFDPLLDSLRIYMVLARSFFFSLFSFSH